MTKLHSEELFTTRDLLGLGSRSSIDNAVSKLVLDGQICRIVQGLFSLSTRKKTVTLLEVATVKANSFGRKIIEHAANIASNLGLTDEGNPDGERWFATDGRTSSFMFGTIRICFKSTSQRKMVMGDDIAGQALRALCFIGKKNMTRETITIATAHLNHAERLRTGRMCALIPYWLSDYFYIFHRPGHSKTSGRLDIPLHLKTIGKAAHRLIRESLNCGQETSGYSIKRLEPDPPDLTSTPGTRLDRTWLPVPEFLKG